MEAPASAPALEVAETGPTGQGGGFGALEVSDAKLNFSPNALLSAWQTITDDASMFQTIQLPTYPISVPPYSNQQPCRSPTGSQPPSPKNSTCSSVYRAPASGTAPS